MQERDTYVLVPNAGCSAVLADRARLPCVRSLPGTGRVLETLRSRYSLDAPYLRPASIVRGDGRRRATALYEFDAPEASWEPLDLEWLALGEADSEKLAPPELAVDVENWLAIAGGGPIPEERPPWVRPGWFAEASSWMEGSIVEAGLQPEGPIEVVEQWPISSVLRRATDDGHVYLKAVFSIFHHEPTLTRALAAEHPKLVPEVIAVEVRRGWMLMRELPGTQIGELDTDRWSGALRHAAALHRHWAGRAVELLSLGASDRTLPTLAVDIEATFEAAGFVVDDGTVSQLARACDELGGGPLPDTLVHGDLHPWNVMADGDDVRIFDWSDACLSHPFFDLPTFLARARDEAVRESMLAAYLEAWADLASVEVLRTAYDVALPLAHVHHAVSYQRINEALEPADRWWFVEEPKRWLARAVELLAAT